MSRKGAYLRGDAGSRAAPMTMADLDTTTPLPLARTRVMRWGAALLLAATALLLISAAALWARYGATVFFEMVTAGMAWCL